MIDSFVLLTPILLLGVIALFGFVGCDRLFDIKEFEKPEPPANFQAVAGDNNVALHWNPNPKATEYTVFRGEMSGVIKEDYPLKTGLSLDQIPYTDKTAKNGTTYYYRVTVKTADGESELSKEEQATPVSPFGSFVTKMPTGTPSLTGRPDWFGMAIHVNAPTGLTIQKVGRSFELGITTAHRVRIVDAVTKAVLGEVSVDMNSSIGGLDDHFKYGDLIPPLNLAAGGDYYVVSEEFQGGDRFFEQDTTVQTRLEASVTSAVEGDVQGVVYSVPKVAGHTYGPVDFQY